MLPFLLASPAALLLGLIVWLLRAAHRPFTATDAYYSAVDEDLDRLSEEERLIRRMGVVLVAETEDYLATVHWQGGP